jgi:hypothetical protein
MSFNLKFELNVYSTDQLTHNFNLATRLNLIKL